MTKLREEQKVELIKRERDRRKISRLRQVRQQTATNAKTIREAVNQKKQLAISDIRAELQVRIQEITVENDQEEKLTPHSNSTQQSVTRSTEKKTLRRRKLTEDDLALAQRRSEDALKRLRNFKQQEIKERKQRAAKRQEATQKANAIMRGDKFF